MMRQERYLPYMVASGTERLVGVLSWQVVPVANRIPISLQPPAAGMPALMVGGQQRLAEMETMHEEIMHQLLEVSGYIAMVGSRLSQEALGARQKASTR